jgi:putative acetyltransferase
MVTIRREEAEDFDAVRHVNERAFGRTEEAELVDRLRGAGKSALSLVASDGGQVIGHIMFSPTTVESEGGDFEALMLAPLAILPEYQRQGVGSKLVTTGLEECRRLEWDLMLVVGHAEYYPRFGFTKARSRGIGCEFEVPDEAWMVIELSDGALAGRTGTARFQPEFLEAM